MVIWRRKRCRIYILPHHWCRSCSSLFLLLPRGRSKRKERPAAWQCPQRRWGQRERERQCGGRTTTSKLNDDGGWGKTQLQWSAKVQISDMYGVARRWVNVQCSMFCATWFVMVIIKQFILLLLLLILLFSQCSVGYQSGTWHET